MRICTDWLKGFYRRLGETGHPLDLDERDVDGRRRRARPFRRVHEAVRAGVRAGRARRRLPGQLPQLRPRDAPARGHRRHGAGRRRDAHLRAAPPATSTSQTRSSESATASASSAGSTSTSSTRATPTPSSAEVQRCLDAAMAGGGYVLRSTGPDLRRQAGPDRAHVRDGRASTAATTERGSRRWTRPTSSTSRPPPTGPAGALPLTADVPAGQPVRRRVRPLAERRHGLGGVEGRAGPVPDPLDAQGGVRADDGTPVALGYHTGHWEVGLLVREAALELDRLGGLPFAAHVSDPCDGRSQGTTGMFDSLPYRNDAALVLRRLVRSLPRPPRA